MKSAIYVNVCVGRGLEFLELGLEVWRPPRELCTSNARHDGGIGGPANPSTPGTIRCLLPKNHATGAELSFDLPTGTQR